MNARLMGGADWREMSWTEYQTMLPEWNGRHGDGGPEPADVTGLARFMAAHTLQ